MPVKTRTKRRFAYPRGLNEHDAAGYLALPIADFRTLVEQGKLPKPHVIGKYRIFDIEDLDRALEELPYEAELDTWADYE
jgi:hypothetical protein